MSSPGASDKNPKKSLEKEISELPDDEDEESRLRDRLLARRANQLKQLIAAEPVDESSSARRSSVGKKSHHHHHKKKKRRHGSIDEEEKEMKSTGRVPSVASTVAVAHSGEPEEEGLTIRPPQTGEYRGHRKKDRDDRSPDRRSKSRTHYRSDNYERDRVRQEKADEGWAHWKKSLDRPWTRGGRSTAAPPFHGSGDYRHSRSPSSKGLGRQSYRPGERSSSPPHSSGRWFHSKSGGVDDRPSSSRHQSSSGRSDRMKGDHRYSAERMVSTVSRPRGDDRGSKRRSKEPVPVPIGASSITVISPEATPTMDEVEDSDQKNLAKSPAPGERKSKDSGSRSSERKQDDKSLAGNSESTRSGSPNAAIDRRSSVESGEHISDEETVKKKRPHTEQAPSEAKRVKYSKFESSSSSSESESEGDMQDQVSVHGSVEEDVQNDEGDVQEEVTEVGAEKEVKEEEVSPEPDYVSTLPVYYPALMGCRSVEEFQSLNRIEEGTYGVVYRAKEKRTDEVVALKRLKMEKEKEGFPITSLREINMLLKAGHHRNIVKVREIVVGSNMDKIYLVMDYVEHDLKSLMETMKHPFLIGEVKTLVKQLLAGVKYLHDNWILHRDLKTSNLLLSHQGVLKIADFGLAREYGDPLKAYTPIVVTLWYRAPELLLGIKKYSTPIDMWSVGCIFAEILTLKAFFPGKSEIEQLSRIFKVLGTPNEQIWPGYNELPGVKMIESFAQVKYNSLRKHFGAAFSDSGIRLLNRFLTYDPEKRITASEALESDWFLEEPRPVNEEMFPTWPAKSEQSRAPRKADTSPKPPSGGKQFSQASDKDYLAKLKMRPGAAAAPGFSLKFDAPKF